MEDGAATACDLPTGELVAVVSAPGSQSSCQSLPSPYWRKMPRLRRALAWSRDCHATSHVGLRLQKLPITSVASACPRSISRREFARETWDLVSRGKRETETATNIRGRTLTFSLAASPAGVDPRHSTSRRPPQWTSHT